MPHVYVYGMRVIILCNRLGRGKVAYSDGKSIRAWFEWPKYDNFALSWKFNVYYTKS